MHPAVQRDSMRILPSSAVDLLTPFSATIARIRETRLPVCVLYSAVRPLGDDRIRLRAHMSLTSAT